MNLLFSSSKGFSSNNFARDLCSLFWRKILAPPSTLTSACTHSRRRAQSTSSYCITYGIVVTGARLKTPVCWRGERAKVVLYEKYLILLAINLCERHDNSGDLVLQGVMMTELKRLGVLENRNGVSDVVGLDVFYIASVAYH